MVYFIADTHFYHTSIIPYCQRPFLSVDDMNKKLIDNWNKVVSNEDIVYFLGDFGFSSAPKLKDITSRLNGYKIMVRGNHDRDRGEILWKNIGFNEVLNGKVEFNYVDKNNNLRRIYLSHEPLYISNEDFNIHGHIHDTPLKDEFPDMNQNNHLCVSVERINYTPISFTEIKEKYLDSFFKAGKEDNND